MNPSSAGLRSEAVRRKTRTAMGDLEFAHALVKVAEIAERHDESKIALLARDAASRLREHRLNVVVFGEFKRGKSTLLNALLGCSSLPTGVVPVTSAVTVMAFGPTPTARITFLNGQVETVSADRLEDFVTESRNPENQKGVRLAEFYLPSDLLRDGVQMIDTPGVGSVFRHNSAVAEEFLESADVAVFVVTADIPIGQGEAEFLTLIAGRVPHVLVVLNKVDRLTQDELKQSLQFTRLNVSKILARECEVLAVSAKRAMEDPASNGSSGIDGLVQALKHLLRNDRSTLAIESGARCLKSCSRDLTDRLALEEAALSAPLQLLEERLAAFRDGMARLRQEREQDLFLIRERVTKQLVSALEQDLDRLKATEFEPAYREVLQAIVKAGGDQSAVRFLSFANTLLAEVLEAHYVPFLEREEIAMRDRIDAELTAFRKHMEAWQRQAYDLAEDLFDLRLPTVPAIPELSGMSRFWVKWWLARLDLSPTFAFFLGLLPDSIWRKRLRLELRAKLWTLFDMNCGTMRYDFVRRIEPSLSKYAQELGDSSDTSIMRIEEVVGAIASKRAEAESSTAAALESVRTDRKLLEAIGGVKELNSA